MTVCQCVCERDRQIKREKEKEKERERKAQMATIIQRCLDGNILFWSWGLDWQSRQRPTIVPLIRDTTYSFHFFHQLYSCYNTKLLFSFFHQIHIDAHLVKMNPYMLKWIFSMIWPLSMYVYCYLSTNLRSKKPRLCKVRICCWMKFAIPALMYFAVETRKKGESCQMNQKIELLFKNTKKQRFITLNLLPTIFET